jgi:hypothetical protein
MAACALTSGSAQPLHHGTPDSPDSSPPSLHMHSLPPYFDESPAVCLVSASDVFPLACRRLSQPCGQHQRRTESGAAENVTATLPCPEGPTLE